MEVCYGELPVGVIGKYGDEVLVETSVDSAERGGASKVISLEAEAKSVSTELLAGEAEVSGKVNYRLLYLDRQGRLCGLDYFKDFKCLVKGKEITPTGKSAVALLVPDAEAKINGDEITLSAVVDVRLSYFGEVGLPCVTSVEGAEVLKETVTTEAVERKERTIELDKVADVGLGIKKVVLFRAEALPVTVSREGEGAKVSGEVRGTLLYLNEAEEVAELTISIPFAEETESETSDYGVVMKSARVVLTDDEDGNSVEVEATLLLTETVYSELSGEALAASCGEKVITEDCVEKVCYEHFVGRECYEEKLGGTLSVESGDAQVAFVRPGCSAIAEVTVGDGEVKVEGVSAFRVVTLSEEGYRSLPAELPFVYLLPAAFAKEGMRAEVSVFVVDATGTLRGKELALSAKVYLEVRVYEERCTSYLSDVKEVGPILESRAGISVYFAEKGEDLWSVAKSVGVLPSALVKANPFLAEPLKESRKVLIFRQK